MNIFSNSQLQKIPKPLVKVISFLDMKENAGEFVPSIDFSFWSEANDLIKPLKIGNTDCCYICAIGLAYIVRQTEGVFSFPNTENEWTWIRALSIIAPISEWTPEIMANVVSSFNMSMVNVGDLNDAITLYCRSYYENGISLLSKLPNQRIAILAGLMEADYSRYREDFHPEDNPEEFATVFILANQIDAPTVESVFETALSFQGFESNNSVSLFLKAHDFLSKDKRVECEKKVMSILSGGSTYSFVPVVCHRLFMRNKTSVFDENCILALIKGLDKEHRDLLCVIDKTVSFRYEGNADFIRRVALCIAETLNPADVLVMEKTLRVFHKSEEPFLKFALSFIMHTKGTYRMTGRRIWDTYHLESSSLDISDLEEDQQCIFIMLMLEDYGNPETRLPKLLPILENGSSKVKSVLMKCLKPYLDDYMGHVIKVMDSLNIVSPETSKIREYFRIRSEKIQARRNLKELSPFITDYNAYQEARRVERKYLQEQIKAAETRYKSTLMDKLSTMVLARGGGFRTNDGKTQHLIPISHSVPTRMLMQAMSPQEQNDWVSRLLKDWNDDTAGNH